MPLCAYVPGCRRTSLLRNGHMMPDGEEEEVRRLLDRYINGAEPLRLPLRGPLENDENRSESGFAEYRHGDSNPGFRRERAAS
jgi:hypothetical protein